MYWVIFLNSTAKQPEIGFQNKTTLLTCKVVFLNFILITLILSLTFDTKNHLDKSYPNIFLLYF